MAVCHRSIPASVHPDRSLRVLHRARKLPRGDKSVTAVDYSLVRPSIFSCRGTQYSWICLVRRGTEERVPCKALCRGTRGTVRYLLAWSHSCTTQLFNKLMISLGYTEYVTQGGDWGHVVRNPYGQRISRHGADDDLP